MLYYNTTTSKRYNERTLALYGFAPDDNDVHELVVQYPSVDQRYETYRDTQDITVVGAVFSVRFEVVNLPHARVLANITKYYDQAIYIKRHGILTAGSHRIQSPETALDTLYAWRSAVQSNIPFKPSISPFVDDVPTLDASAMDEIIAATNAHLEYCDTLSLNAIKYLSTNVVDAFKAKAPELWVDEEYQALASA